MAGFVLLSLALIGTSSLHARPKPAPVASTPDPSLLLPQTDYFFSIDLDPQYKFVGTGALSEDQAAPANCYHFSTNDAGQIKQIEYRRAGILVQDPFLGVASIDFEYQPGIERRWYHDADGKSVLNVYGIAGEELTLNSAGFPIEIANLDATGGHIRDSGGVISYVRTLDEKNRVITLRRIGLLGTAITDKGGYFETRTVYDDQSRPVERGNYDSSGSPLNNVDGVATVRTIYTAYPDTDQTTESYFDASGLPVDDKSIGVHSLQRTVDKRGLPVSEAYFDANGTATIDSQNEVHEKRYAYDDRGNEISESFFDVDGKSTNRKTSGYACKSYKYDDKNRVVEIDFLGDDGTPQVPLNLGAAIIRQEYDDKGNIVRRQFFDGLGHPSNHVQYGSPAIRIKVEGDTTTVMLRNADDKPMRNSKEGFYSFSYKTDTDTPLTFKNKYYDRQGNVMSLLRIQIINPHLAALKSDLYMARSARYGAGAVGLGALLAAFLAWRKSTHTKRRKVYVPSPLERFLGWFAVFAIFEGSLRFFMTIYWAEVGYQNGQMGPSFYILETIFIIFFLYRMFRMRLTMRVLNIEREDIHRLVRDFFTKARLKPEWNEERKVYHTSNLDVRVNYFQSKYHAYLAFRRRRRDGRLLSTAFAQHIRTQANTLVAPVRTKGIALYYPIVAACYVLLSCTAFYTLWQLIKRN